MKKVLFVAFAISNFNSICQELKPKILSQTSIRLSVIDLDKSEKYYNEVFGFESLPMPDSLFRSVRRWLKMANGAELHLEVGRVKIIDSNYSNGIHFYLSASKADTEKVKGYLDSKKIPITSITGIGTSSSKIYINDPDGYVIELKELN